MFVLRECDGVLVLVIPGDLSHFLTVTPLAVYEGTKRNIDGRLAAFVSTSFFSSMHFPFS